MKPDLVVILGDFVFEDDADAFYLEPLRDLTARVPTVAVLGNHDYDLAEKDALDDELAEKINEERASLVADVLKAAGVKVLVNDIEEIKINEKKFILAGIDELLTGRATIIPSLVGRDEKIPVIVLTHNPDFVLLPEKSLADLVLAAHTHGGQIRLPWFGPVPKLPTTLGREYDQGYFEYRGTPLIITRGVSESGPRARLFAPPEIMVVNVSL